LFKGVEATLSYGTRTPPAKQLADTNKKFEEQYEAINAYINKYLGPGSETKLLDWQEVIKKDKVAGGLIERVKADVVVKVSTSLPIFDFVF